MVVCVFVPRASLFILCLCVFGVFLLSFKLLVGLLVQMVTKMCKTNFNEFLNFGKIREFL